MKRFFQYFGFSKIEQNGFIVLAIIIILVLFVPYFIRLYTTVNPKSVALVYFDNKLNEQANRSEQDLNYPVLEHPVLITSNKKEIKYFMFDPNNLKDELWSQLGFTAKQIRVIKNYEAKGGKFYRKEDVRKIYVISTSDYNRIEPYIQIDIANFKSPTSSKETSLKDSIKKKVILNLNSTDTTHLKLLSGIGSVYANRIVNYRDALGGFYSLDQLKEVYGLTVETLDKISPFLQIDNLNEMRKLNVNTSSLDSLSKHPYISRKQAQTIVNYRLQHGRFEQVESLLKIQSLDKEFLRKIEPYLEF